MSADRSRDRDNPGLDRTSAAKSASRSPVGSGPGRAGPGRPGTGGATQADPKQADPKQPDPKQPDLKQPDPKQAGRRISRRAVALTVASVVSAALLAVAGCADGLTTDRPSPGAPAPGATVQSGGSSAPAASPTSPTSAAPLSASAPQRLSIPAIGVDTPLVRLGLAADRTVQVPPIEADSPAGWYDGSVTPGQRGSSVILGHVTVGRYGDGVFLRLGQLKSGDRIDVHRADGSTADFTVTSTRTYSKSDFPDQQVYGPDPQPVLRLVTCAGTPNPTAHTYPDNLVVTAVLTGSTGTGG